MNAPTNSIGRDLEYVVRVGGLSADDRRAVTAAVTLLDTVWRALDAGDDDAATVGEIVLAMQAAGYPIERTNPEDCAL